jgi:hypothetical protein
MFNVTRVMKIKVSSLLVCVFLSSVAFAQEMTVERYVSMELQARQVTLDGVRDRLALLSRGADMSEQLEQDGETQKAIEAIYKDSSMTPAQAIAWATQNKGAIEAWLIEHQEQQAEYDRIARELDEVSRQIQAIANQ